MGLAAALGGCDEEDQVCVAVGAGEVYAPRQTSKGQRRLRDCGRTAVRDSHSARNAGAGLGLAGNGRCCELVNGGGAAGVVDQRGQVGND